MTRLAMVLLAIWLGCSLTGCAVMGRALKGAGDGLANANSDRQVVYCHTNGYQGTYTTSCR